MKNWLLSFSFFLIFFLNHAQDSVIVPLHERVTKTFRSTTFVTSQTIETQPERSFQLLVQHRFGQINTHKQPLKSFFGLDLPSNIRFGFVFPVFRNLDAGIGRTKYNKQLDADIKYVFLHQTTDNYIPLSLAFYFNTSYITDDFPETGSNYFFADGITPFKYRKTHRLAYSTQMMAARKINNTFSVQTSAVYVYKNLADTGVTNYRWALPTALRIKTGFMSAIIAEYALLPGKPHYFVHPFSLAFEVITTTHSFQVFITSKDHIPYNNMYTLLNDDVTKGLFYIGFNLHKTFYFQKK